MDVPLVLVNIGIQQGFKGYKRKSSTFCYWVDVDGLSALYFYYRNFFHVFGYFGHFYIACAHGLHRTDIALCLYWVFYAADKGIAPPPIRGYREDKGLDTHKIMRALNGMYEYMTHRNGKEPMPIETFRKRKEIIKVLSRRSD